MAAVMSASRARGQASIWPTIATDRSADIQF